MLWWQLAHFYSTVQWIWVHSKTMQKASQRRFHLWRSIFPMAVQFEKYQFRTKIKYKFLNAPEVDCWSQPYRERQGIVGFDLWWWDPESALFGWPTKFSNSNGASLWLTTATRDSTRSSHHFRVQGRKWTGRRTGGVVGDGDLSMQTRVKVTWNPRYSLATMTSISVCIVNYFYLFNANALIENQIDEDNSCEHLESSISTLSIRSRTENSGMCRIGFAPTGRRAPCKAAQFRLVGPTSARRSKLQWLAFLPERSCDVHRPFETNWRDGDDERWVTRERRSPNFPADAPCAGQPSPTQFNSHCYKITIPKLITLQVTICSVTISSFSRVWKQIGIKSMTNESFLQQRARVSPLYFPPQLWNFSIKLFDPHDLPQQCWSPFERAHFFVHFSFS